MWELVIVAARRRKLRYTGSVVDIMGTLLERPTSNLNYLKCADWGGTKMDGFESIGEDRQSNLTGIVLRISSVMLADDGYPSGAFTHFADLLKYSDELPIELNVLSTLQAAMHFSFRMRFTDRWGECDPKNSKWDGMVSHLLAGEADLALSATQNLPLTHQVVDFNIATQTWKYLALYRKATFQQESFGHLLPFSTPLWVATFVWAVIASISMILLQKIQSWNSHSFYSFLNLTADALVLSTRLLGAQGLPSVAAKWLPRLLVLIFGLTAFLLNASYGGTLLSFMSVQKDKFTDFTELLNTSYKFALRDSYEAQQALAKSESAHVREAYTHSQQSPSYDRPEQAKTHIMAGSFVYISSSVRTYLALQKNFTINERCAVRELPLPVAEIRLSTMVPKGSKYKRVIDYQLLRAKQFGLNDLWLRRREYTRPKCLLLDPFVYQTISLPSVTVPVYAICAGGVLAALFWILEFAIIGQRDRLD